MKISMKKVLAFLLTLMMLSTTVYAKDRPKENYEAYHKTHKMILKNMNKDLLKGSKTGDITLDFLNQMLTHHKGAIALVENELTNGDNPIIWQFARGIQKNCLKQSEQMKQLLRELKEQKMVDKEKEAQYLTKYERIVTEMMDELSETDCEENVDKAFVLQMIVHHKGTIKIAQNILAYTPNVMVQEIAGKIIDRQSKEIKQMEKFAREIR